MENESVEKEQEWQGAQPCASTVPPPPPAAQSAAEGTGPAEENGPSCHGCPLGHIPLPVWQEGMRRLLHRPFRKRHPFVFWGGWLTLIAVIVICLAAGSDSDDVPSTFGEARIALVEISGVIDNTKPTLEWLRRIEKSDAVKGILLRVDSPGGGVGASQELYAALKRVGAKKPLAVSMGATAASGGLMASMAGQRVFAGPSTVTGSIGVRMDIPQVKALLDKVGVGRETLVTGAYKDAGSPLRPLSERDRAYFEGLMHDMHEQFVAIVAEGRGMSPEAAQALADGRAFTGREALKLGLIDALGDPDDAHAWLAEKTGVPKKRKLLACPKEEKWYKDLLTSLLGITPGSMGLEATGTPAFSYRF